MTYVNLYDRAIIIAKFLHKCTEFQDRIVLMFDNGFDFLASFYGCVLSGRIAVPAYPPLTKSSAERLRHIVKEADAKVILTHSVVWIIKKINLLEKLKNIPILKSLYKTNMLSGEISSFLKTFPIVDVGTIKDDASQFALPLIRNDNIVLLQYTSGSTSHPKGVIVSHENIVANARLIAQAFNLNETSRALTWLPALS